MEKKSVTILGAIAGDTIGSIYEFCPTKEYNFPLLDERMEYTDDSIMTIAVADWILSDPQLSHNGLAKKMRYWGNKYRYPMGSYGGTFSAWLNREEMGPYNSWGNGSAMRVSPVGFAFDSLEETLRVAKISAEITHNHPEAVKGAEAVAVAVYLARTGSSKADIKEHMNEDGTYSYSYIEKIKKAPLKVAKRYFCKKEVSFLEKIPEAARGEEFFRLWTIKESFVKMLKKGLAMGLDSFEVSFGESISIKKNDEKVACHIKEYNLEGYKISVCAEEESFADEMDIIEL